MVVSLAAAQPVPATVDQAIDAAREAATNAGFFDDIDTIYGDIGIGYKGEGRWRQQTGTPANRQRWAFGWQDWNAERHSVGPAAAYLRVPGWIEKECRWGVSGIGCLYAGTPRAADESDWEEAQAEPGAKHARVLLLFGRINGPTYGKLVISVVGRSWTWDEARAFATTRVRPDILEPLLKSRQFDYQLAHAMMLDGGMSSKFFYRDGQEWEEYSWQASGRKVPNFVRGGIAY